MTTNLPPTWDLASYFPSFDAPQRTHFEAELTGELADALARASALAGLSQATAEAWEALVLRYEELVQRLTHLASYTNCLCAADAREPRFMLAEARLNVFRANLEKLENELRRSLAAGADAEFARFAARPAIEHAAYLLGRLRKEAKLRMASELEGLAADLGTDGIMAWGRLYDSISGRLTFNMAWPDGRSEVLPVSQRRSLMGDADRRVRIAAFERGNEAWSSVAETLAAALNHIAGTRLTLNARRGIPHFLDVALHQAAISKKTLDAMFTALAERIEVPRRGLLVKASALGLTRAAWYDLEAALPVQDAGPVPFERAVEQLRSAFARAYPRLAGYFEHMLAQRWIDAAPSATKRPGAFCTGSELTGETRIFMTYQGALGDVSTLAHEVGHAFHAELLRPRKTLERQYPMTLAESASTFAEAILADGLLADPALPRSQRALLLGKVVSDGVAFLLDVPTRFSFEHRFYEERALGEVTTSRLCELMVQAQRAQFGDTLADGGEDPLFWASKLHFFIPDLTFYNFPYTFGYLLSRGMYAMFQREGAPFLQRYQAFLEQSGRAMAHEVAQTTLGCDLESKEFWIDAIETLIAPTDELERLLGG